jgi:hypothetical protein
MSNLNEDSEYVKDILKTLNSYNTNPEFINFREKYTKDISSLIKDGVFVMSDELASDVILYVSQMIKNCGYNITRN